MSSMQHKNSKIDEDDDNWLPFDYESDIDDIPLDEDMPPPDSELGEKYAIAPTPQCSNDIDDVNQMPEVDTTPHVEEKKTIKKKGTSTNNYTYPEDKEDREIQALLDRYDRSIPETKTVKKLPAAAKSKKAKSYPTGSQDVERHQSLLMQIDRYRMSERFADVLRVSGLRLSGIEDHSIEELQDLLTRIRTVVGNRSTGGGGILGSGLLMATAVVEKLPITNRFADINGLSGMLSNDQEFMDIVEQLSIDYSILSVMSPEKRLLLLMVKSGMRMNSINQMKANIIAASYMKPDNSPQPINNAPIIEPSIVSAGNDSVLSPGDADLRRY